MPRRSAFVRCPAQANHGLEIADCRQEALGVELDDLLIVTSPDHRTLPIACMDPADDQGERFDFLRLKLATEANEDGVDAWLFVAYHCEYRKQPRRHDVIVKHPFSVYAGMQCQLQIPHWGIVLAYRDCRTIVV